MHTWVCPHGYIHLQGLRLQQLLPFCSRGNRPSSSVLAHLHCPIPLAVIAPPILSVYISSEMLCSSAATCWSPTCVFSFLLSEETPQYSVLLLHEFEHVLSSYFIPLALYYAQQFHTVRFRGMGTGISEASKRVPISSFATQGGKQVSSHFRQGNWVQARDAQIRFPAG